MNIGRLDMTLEFLESVLGLPEGHHIRHVVPQSGDDLANRLLSLMVEGETCPEHMENTQVERIGLTWGVVEGRRYIIPPAQLAEQLRYVIQKGAKGIEQDAAP